MIRKLLLLCLLLSTPLAAQDAPLFIERIEVRNHKRVSPDVVVAESRLREGREYSEADLRDAATRLSRLPFLLSVDFSLEKGSERGRHILVLTINETKPFFFLIDGVVYFEDSPFVSTEYEDRPGNGRENLAVGARWFVGRRGAVHVAFSGIEANRAFTREYAAFVAGYTHYDLFGTRAFATLNLKRPIEGYGEGRLSPQLVLGAPLSANQTLTLEYDETRFQDETELFGTEHQDRFGQRLVSARWSYNTTNDPFFPTRGTLLSVAPHYAWTDGGNVSFSIEGELITDAFHSRTYGTRIGATRFVELSERSSVWADVRADWAQLNYSDERHRTLDSSASSAGVGVGYAFSLWSAEERAHGDSRFEFIARYTNRPDFEYDSPFREDDHDVFQASGAWVRRTSWGTLRLGVGYAW